MGNNLATPVIATPTSVDCVDVWSGVLLDIEEEGVLSIIQESGSTGVIHSAWLTAYRSPLLAGIGCNHEKLVVHYKNLPTSAPLSTLTCRQNNHDRRSIGNSAARLVKGIPFRKCHS